jgi:hypothetical protein
MHYLPLFRVLLGIFIACYFFNATGVNKEKEREGSKGGWKERGLEFRNVTPGCAGY